MPDVILCERCQHTLSARAPPNSISSSAQIRSLYLPNNIEASNIASTVEELDADLARYDQEISKLETILDKLDQHIETLLRSRDEHRSLIAPVRKLPVEILGEIFDIVCRSKYGLKLKRTPTKTVTLSLSQVCSVWRETVRSTPALWSHLWIDISRSFAHRLISYHLELSGEAPLTLVITASHPKSYVYDDGDDLYPDELEDHAWGLLEMLVDHSWRWKDITMRFAWSVFCKMRTSLCDMIPYLDWDSLEALTLEWNTAFATEQREFGLWKNSGDLPNLKHLSLPTYRAWFPFPFTQLSSFGSLRGWDFSTAVELFKCCHGIGHFDMTSHDWDWTPLRGSNSLPSATLPSPVQVLLRSLSIRNGTRSDAYLLFDSLIVDRLKSLTIEGKIMEEGQSWQSLTKLIRRSQCSLQRLTLFSYDCMIATNDLLQFLAHVPTLTHLAVRSGPRRTLADAFFKTLTVSARADSDDSGTPRILPLLQYMDLSLMDCGLRISYGPLPAPTAILTMVESRSPLTPGGIETLKSFKLSLHLTQVRHTKVNGDVETEPGWEVDRQSQLRIQALIEGGMELSITDTQSGVHIVETPCGEGRTALSLEFGIQET